MIKSKLKYSLLPKKLKNHNARTSSFCEQFFVCQFECQINACPESNKGNILDSVIEIFGVQVIAHAYFNSCVIQIVAENYHTSVCTALANVESECKSVERFDVKTKHEAI